MNAASRRAAGLAAIAGAGAAWEMRRRADRRSIARDPAAERLRQPLEGRVREVRSADGTFLHVEEFGPAEGPALVLVHGWTCTLRFWTLQIQAFSPSVRVIAYDLRGHGASAPAADGDYSVRAHASDLDAVLRATAAGPAVVAGHSLGGMTLVAWAGAHADEVGERLVAAALVNTGMGDLISEALVLRAPGPLAAARQLAGRAILGASAPLPRRPTPISHRAVRYLALSPSASPAEVAFCEQIVLACPRTARAGTGGALSTLDLRDAIAHLHVPTVVIAGEHDRLTPPVHAHTLADALPDPHELIVLPGAGHMTPVTQPDAVNARLRELLARHAGVRTLSPA
jgi:pimeloyl-ACP methyl ester carboxylesterase